MFISNHIIMTGDWQTIWDLSSQIEQWDMRLPHYRKVKMAKIDDADEHYVAFMSAWRDILPVWWRSEQTRHYNQNPALASIHYKHIEGLTRGMQVIWTFTPTANPDELLVEISHDWTPSWFLIGNIASRLICQYVVHNIADKTLATIRDLAQSHYQSNQLPTLTPKTTNLQPLKKIG